MSTLAPAKTITFVSEGPNTMLTYETGRKVRHDPLGNVVVAASPGKRVQFEKNLAVIGPATTSDTCPICTGNGLLVHDGEAKDCPKCEGNGQIERDASKVNGSLVDVPFDRLIDWLRNHPDFNQMHKPCCFYEEGNAPDEPKPTLTEQMTRLAEASTLQSLDLIGEVRELEESTHQRVAILQACEAAEKTIALLTADDTDPEAEAAGEGEPDESGSVADDDESSA